MVAHFTHFLKEHKMHGNKEGIIRSPQDIRQVMLVLTQLMKHHGWEKISIDLVNINVPQTSCTPMDEQKWAAYLAQASQRDW